MRTFPRLKTVTTLGVTLAAAVSLLALGHPACAQAVIPSEQSNPVGAIRLGAFFPFNSTVKNTVGKTFVGGGVDYSISHKMGVSRTVLSLDYIERSSGGHTIRFFPLTIGEFTYQNADQGTVRPYFGVGVGPYFVHTDVINDAGFEETNNKTMFGGYFAVGADFPENFFLDARYHIVQNIGSVNVSGLQVSLGYRF